MREYARLLLIEEDETMTPVEDFKDVLMQEYLAMGTYLKLTERDMMLLIFKGHFEPRHSPGIARLIFRVGAPPLYRRRTPNP